MKNLKRILWGIASLIVLGVLFVFMYLQHNKPSYSGSVEFEEISGVEVYYDSIGVPHIFANTERKALTALGYLHAKERLWQMELLRRIASGRLAEILGEDLVDVDVFFSSLGIDKTVHKQVKNLENSPQVKQMAEAYLKGVNKYINEGKTPLEFTLLGIDKEYYSMEDTFYVSAYMAFSFAHAFKTDPLLSYIKENYGNAYLEDLGVLSENTLEPKNGGESNLTAQTNVDKLLKKLPFPQFIGSNGFALAPKKTTTGKVIFENDPHIGYAQPCVWYQAHIKTPTYENYGFYLGLMPFPLLAHNRDYAFGITMFENDDINFYQLKTHPTNKDKYISSTGEHRYKKVKKVIKIKGGNTKEIEIMQTTLGPIFNHHLKPLDSLNPIAIQWVYNEKPSKVLETAYHINHVSNIQEFENSLQNLSAPGLNFIYGDKEDNIGLWSAGQLYSFKEEINTKFILNGLDSLHTEKEWVSFQQNPKTVNPDHGYVVTANAQVPAVNGVLYQGYYLPKNREKAIEKRILNKDRLSFGDAKNIATSHTSETLVTNVKNLVKGIDIDEMSDYELYILDRLLKWKGNHYLENIEPTIYYKWMFKVFKHTFKDELGEELFKQFTNTSLSRKVENRFLMNTHSVWWDDVNTNKKERFTYIVTNSFKQSVKELRIQLGDEIEEWQWKRVHTISHAHALAKVGVLKTILNVQETPVAGGRETINNIMFPHNDNGVYKADAGPSTRRLIDFSDVENSVAVLPTGQSGHFLSPYYKNQATYYNQGKYYKMLMNEQEIRALKQKITFE
ncbi:penicillin acylase family protein [Wenyingzhuangia sp. IMCC45533]